LDKAEAVDSSFLEKLTKNYKSRFKTQFKSELESIDDEDVKELVSTEFENTTYPKHKVFEAVKNAFHPDNSSGYRTEYEVSFTNPLYEVEENPADLLLTETNHRTVNLCFVVCEASGENCYDWPARVNEVVDVVVGHKARLLEQLGHGDKTAGHIQYATAVPKTEIPDVDFKYLRESAPDEYALWSVDDDYEPDDDSIDDPPMVLLQHEEGSIEHAKLKSPVVDGIDYLDSKNSEISIALTTPDLISIQETLMTLLTQQHVNRLDEPREFNKSDFVRTFVDLCEVGPSGEEKEEVLVDEAESLIETAKDAGIVYYGDSDSIHENRDFRARYSQGNTTEGLKSSIESKIFDSRVPQKKADLAYDQVKSEFEPEDHVGTEADDW